MRTKEFMAFIAERLMILRRKQAGEPKPWTKDPILRDYRFCNVDREEDTVTKWIAREWRRPTDRDNWFAMAVARWINWPDTLEEVGYPVPFTAAVRRAAIATMHRRKEAGEKVWTGAYMIGTQGNAKDKASFIIEDVLHPLWLSASYLRPKSGDTLDSFASRIVAVKNQGTFMVGQIVADIKQTDPILMAAPDWHTWAISGPGSRRGLNRVMGYPVDQGWKPGTWERRLRLLQEDMEATFDFKLDAQNIQNCLCEFDKYERVRRGEGRPRSLYPGKFILAAQ